MRLEGSTEKRLELGVSFLNSVVSSADAVARGAGYGVMLGTLFSVSDQRDC